MDETHRSYYDIVKLSHKQEKVYKSKECQCIISSEITILQRSKSHEENLNDIFPIDTAAAIPYELLDPLSICCRSESKRRPRKETGLFSTFQPGNLRRRTESHGEPLTQQSSSSECDLFGLRSMEAPTMSDHHREAEHDLAKCDNLNGDVINGMLNIGNSSEVEKNQPEAKDGVFEETLNCCSLDTVSDEPLKHFKETMNKTRIISCQSDDSTGFEESRKFVSDTDLSLRDKDEGTWKSQRSTSLDDIHQLFNGGETLEKNFGDENHQNKRDTSDEQISATCSTYRSKDSLIRKLEQELKESFKLLSEKDEEVRAICADKEGDGWAEYAETEEENTKLRKDMIELKAECSRLHALYHSSVTSLEKAKHDLTRLKGELEAREKYHEKTYLKMYEKGQKAALIEREQQLEELACENPKSVSTQELLDKLNHTQSELGRWQTLARQESYESAIKPGTDSEATLQFMKDCMFHYLTDKEECGLHLRAMVRMLGFTEAEKRNMIGLRRKVKKQCAEYYSGVLLNP